MTEKSDINVAAGFGDGKPIYLDVIISTFLLTKNDRIIDVKKKIHDKMGQRLEYRGESLVCGYYIGGNSDFTISEPTIEEESRGVCLIISNEYFTNGLPSRSGTKLDEEQIEKTFKCMGYKVKIHRNVPRCEMNNVIEDTKKFIKSSHTMLVVFVLSHGEENGLVTVDGQIFPFKDICTPFSNIILPELAGKPKLFFFVCCRGKEENQGANAVLDSSITNVCPTSITVGPKSPKSSIARVPGMTDFFIQYVTCQRYGSCPSLIDGTVYVSTLCDVIWKHRLWNIMDIHMEVQHMLSKRDIRGRGSLQMLSCEDSLSAGAYFVDGY